MSHDSRLAAIDRNIDLMAHVDRATDAGWTPLWCWSANVKGFTCYLESVVKSLTHHTHELLFADGVVMPASVCDNHRGRITGYGWDSSKGTALGAGPADVKMVADSVIRRDKPVAYRVRWDNLQGRG